MPPWIYHCTPHHNVVHPSCGKVNLLDKGSRPCTLVQMRLSIGNTGFSNSAPPFVYTWGLMLILTIGSKIVTRKTFHGSGSLAMAESSGNGCYGIEKQIEEVGLGQPQKYLGFLGTLFLFLAAASSFHRHSRL